MNSNAIQDLIEAVQADRRNAYRAGNLRADEALHTHIVLPLNTLFARAALSQMSVTWNEVFEAMRKGVDEVSESVPPALLTNTRAALVELERGDAANAASNAGENAAAAATVSPAASTASAPVNSAADDTPGSVFVGARGLPGRSVLYWDSEGNQMRRDGGSRSWRNNNPGNIVKGPYCDGQGAIGDDGTFAIFPDEQKGFDAIVTLLGRPTYVDRTLRGAIHRYAPPHENDSDGYAAFVSQQTGLAPDTVLNTLSPAELVSIANAIRDMEGWKPGVEERDQPASLSAVSGMTRGGGAISSAAPAAATWMKIAQAEADLPAHERSEWRDEENNPRILKYLRVGLPGWTYSTDDTHWCAAFVNYCLIVSGHTGTEHPGARSFFWNEGARFVVLPGPSWGCIGVIRRENFDDPKWEGGKGHVGFVVSWDDDGVTLLGGNQSDTVNETKYPWEERDGNGALKSRFEVFLMPAMT